MENCPFCNYINDEKGTIILENKFCVCIELNEKVLEGSCMIIPKAHRVTVFDLNSEEWGATKDLIDKVKQYLDDKYKPNGYSVGWNCGEVGGQHVLHVHLHVIPRYANEPFARCGIRSWIKSVLLFFKGTLFL